MDFYIKREKILLTVIVLWVIIVSLWYLRSNPSYWFDEGIYHQIVRNLVTDKVMGLRLSPTTFSGASLISVGYPVFYPAVVAFKFFGDSVLVLRMTAVIFLIGFFISAYYLVRNLYGVKNAIFSATLISLFSPLYGNGKTFLGEVPGMFYFVLGLFFLNFALVSEHKKRNLLFFFGGLLCGLAVSSKPNFLVILPAIVVGVIWKWRQFFSTPSQRKNTVIMLIGIALPVLFWFYSQFGVSASVSQIFAHYSNPYYIKDIWPVIFLNLRRFVTESTPLHFLLLFVVAGSFLVLKIKKRQALYFAEVVIMAFVAAIFIFYVRTTGWYRYFFPAHLLLFIFIPVGMEYVINNMFGFLKKYSNLLILFVVVVLAIAQLSVMRIERFYAGYDIQAKEISFIESLEDNESILFYNVPFLAGRYQSDNYYQFIKMSDYLSYGDENLPLLNSGFFTYVFAEEPLDFIMPDCYNNAGVLQKTTVFKLGDNILCE